MENINLENFIRNYRLFPELAKTILKVILNLLMILKNKKVLILKKMELDIYVMLIYIMKLFHLLYLV